MTINPCVIVPMYKTTPTREESRSIENLYNKLSTTQIIYIVPKRLEDKLTNTNKTFISFNDYYFQSIITYSQLLESSLFWGSFLEFSHGLIHQEDCYLLGDARELEFWCKLNYFFVGPGHFKEYNYEKYPYELQNTLNGGFSLRNIKQHYDICKELESKGFDHKKCQAHEDTFWIQMAQKFEMRLPDPLTAIRFGFEQGASTLYNLIGQQKPFGLHAPFKYRHQYGDVLWNKLLFS